MLRNGVLPVLLGLCLAASAQAQERRAFDSERGPLQVTRVAGGLESPWGLAFLPGGQEALVAERPGRLRRVGLDGQVSAPLEGVPKVYARAQGGLLDVALSPDFEEDRLVYLTYAEQGADGKAGTAAGRARLSADGTRREGFEVIFRQQPKLSEGLHFGSRLVFDRDGYLFIVLGENNQRAEAQRLSSHQGSVVRLLPDGRVPEDNPFVGQAQARPEIWAYGLRNQQGAAIDPRSGALWATDHGPRGGDELNILRAGVNYGWPRATHGINYSGLRIPEAEGETVDGTQPPQHVWKVSPGLSGMTFYDGQGIPDWRGNLFVGALADRSLIRLELDGDRVVHEERLLKGLGARIRSVVSAPDGFLYVLTDDADGELLRLSPGGR